MNAVTLIVIGSLVVLFIAQLVVRSQPKRISRSSWAYKVSDLIEDLESQFIPDKKVIITGVGISGSENFSLTLFDNNMVLVNLYQDQVRNVEYGEVSRLFVAERLEILLRLEGLDKYVFNALRNIFSSVLI